jgi:hypothetical protein
MECPDVRRIESDVSRRLGRSPFVPGAAPPGTIEAFVSKEESVFEATIAMRGSAGELLGSRSVESTAPDCASLGAAAGLAIALMVEPILVEARPSSAQQPVQAPVVVRPERQPERAVSETESRPSGGFTAGVAIAAQTLPRVSAGVTTRGEVGLGHGLIVAAGAFFFPEQSVENASSEVAFGMTLGAIGPCYRLELERSWALSSCASLLVGALHVSVETPEPVEPGQNLWLGASAGLRLGWTTAALELGTELLAFAHFDRQAYVVEGVGAEDPTSVFVEPSIGALGTLTAGVRF